MSDYLNNLVAKSLNRAEMVQPRLPSVFEPSSATGRFMADLSQTEFETTRDEPFTDQMPSVHTPNTQMPGKGKADASDWRISSGKSTVAHATSSDSTALRHSGQPSLPRLRTHSTEPLSSAEAQDKRLASEKYVRRNEPVNLREVLNSPSAEQINGPSPSETQLVHPAYVISQEGAKSLVRQPAPPTAESLTAQKTGPTIKVTIGRVDVRAIMPAQPAPRRTSSARPSPLLSLDDYLKQGEGGKR